MYRFSTVMDTNGKLHDINIEDIAYILPDINIIGFKNNKEIKLMEKDCKQLCFDIQIYKNLKEANRKMSEEFIRYYKELKERYYERFNR